MASRTPPIDPRLANAPEPPEEGGETSVRPVVALPRSGPSAAVIALVAVAAAVLLFVVLETRRSTPAEPAIVPRGTDAAGTAAPPPLYIPPAPAPVAVVPAPVEAIVPAAPRAAPSPPPPSPRPQPEPVIRYMPQPQVPIVPSLPPPPQRQSNSPTVVLDTTQGSPAGPNAGPGQPGDRGSLADTFEGRDAVSRVRSGIFANRSTTVAQGTLVPAVLETAFDSRRPGFARAIVSRDVRGFDGKRVLIPRGSRLTGEYRSDIQPGQKRALINWTRLIRPDGVTIALGSPAADTLGRGGVKGDYNSHFFERFASAVLQSALEVGANLGTRAAGGNVIIGLPGSTQNLSPLLQTTRVLPTLTVPAGTSISVFVARDLDFSASEKEK